MPNWIYQRARKRGTSPAKRFEELHLRLPDSDVPSPLREIRTEGTCTPSGRRTCFWAALRWCSRRP